jgi:hypothetical protein
MPKLNFEQIYGNEPLAVEDVPKIRAIREGFKNLALLIDEKCPDSRERSTAFTNLESALFWAEASVNRNGKN